MRPVSATPPENYTQSDYLEILKGWGTVGKEISANALQ